MNELDQRLTFLGSTVRRKYGRTWIEAEVYSKGTPSGFYCLAFDYDREESYIPKWMKNPDGKPTLFTREEVDDFVHKWLRT